MLPAVGFDHQLPFQADEISNVWPDLPLTPELEP